MDGGTGPVHVLSAGDPFLIGDTQTKGKGTENISCRWEQKGWLGGNAYISQ